MGRAGPAPGEAQAGSACRLRAARRPSWGGSGIRCDEDPGLPTLKFRIWALVGTDCAAALLVENLLISVPASDASE